MGLVGDVATAVPVGVSICHDVTTWSSSDITTRPSSDVTTRPSSDVTSLCSRRTCMTFVALLTSTS